MARKPPSNEKGYNGYSADEFKRQLLTWFQDRGLLSDLQAHLRHQMILALRDTSLNINSTGSFYQVGSPKTQAINLLVAEFLLRQECHYTLSVFTSEVPLLRNIPDFSCGIDDIELGGKRSPKDQFPGFHERDVFDILEALGFSPNSEESQQVNELYEHSHGEALLTCLIRSLPDKFGSSVKDLCEKCRNSKPADLTGVKEVFLHTPLFTEDVQNLFLELNAGPQQIFQLHSAVKRVVEEEVVKAQEEEKAKYHKLLIEREQRIQELWQEHDEKMQERLVRAGEKLKDKQTKLSRELGQKHAYLAVLATQLREQQNEVSKRLNYVQERSDLLEQKEVEFKVLKKESEDILLTKQQKLEDREKHIEQELLRLNAETKAREHERKELEANCIKIEQASQTIMESHSAIALLRDLQKHHCLLLEADEVKYESKEKQEVPSRKILQSSAQAVQVDLNKHKGAIPKKHNVHQQTIQVPCEDQSLQTQISGSDIDDVFLHLRVQSTENERRRSQHEMINNMIENLEQENTELRGHVAQQRLRIEELTVQTSQLMHHLSEVNSLTRLRSQPASHEIDQGVQTSPVSDSSPARPIPNRNPCPMSGGNSYQASTQPVLPQASVQSASRASFRGFVRSNEMGTFEESSFSHRLPPNSYIPLYSSSLREQYRKPLQRITTHSFSSSDESSPSPTEEMLSEARHRLRRLEKETDAVDRCYQEFRIKHVDKLTNTASILFQPTSNKFGASGLSNTPTAPLAQNQSSILTSSQSRLLQPQVPLLNQVPSTSVLQPDVLNTAFLYPSSQVSEHGRQFYNPSQLQSNMNISTGYPVTADSNSVSNSTPWRRPIVSNSQTPPITHLSPFLEKYPRNAMRLPATLSFNKEARHLPTSRNQRSQHVLRPQQEPPPCIVSAPQVPLSESETLVDNISFHSTSSQAHFTQENVNSRMRNYDQQFLPVKNSFYNNVHQSLRPSIESLRLSDNEGELELCKDKLQGKDEKNRSNSDKEKSVGSEKETLDDTNDTKSCNENTYEDASKGEKIENNNLTGEIIVSIRKNKFSKTEEERELSSLNAINDAPRAEALSEVREHFYNEIPQHQRHKKQVPDPLKTEGFPPVNIIEDELGVLSDHKHLNVSDKEKIEDVSRNINSENRVHDITVPAVDELVHKNSEFNNIGNDFNIFSVKSEECGERIANMLVNDTLKEYSQSPSLPSIIGSSNEISSDVISAGSPGEGKSGDTW